MDEAAHARRNRLKVAIEHVNSCGRRRFSDLQRGFLRRRLDQGGGSTALGAAVRDQQLCVRIVELSNCRARNAVATPDYNSRLIFETGRLIRDTVEETPRQT